MLTSWPKGRVAPRPVPEYSEGHAPSSALPSHEADTYEVVTDLAGFDALEGEWGALCGRAGGHRVSQTFAWARASWETRAAPRGRRLLCLVARRGGRLGLVWPFVTYRNAFWSVAHPLGPEASEYSDVLVEAGPDAERRVEAAWHVLRIACHCDVIAVPRVCAHDLLGRVMARVTAPAVVLTFPLLAVRWDGITSWGAYIASISRKKRKELARTRRRLTELGELRFEFVTEPARCELLLDWILHRKRAWLARARLTNRWIFSSSYRDFLSASIAALAPGGRRGIFTLSVEGRVIAALLSDVTDTSVELLMSAFEPDFSKFAPGQLLRENALQWSYDRGLTCDFRFGDDADKYMWHASASHANTYTCANTAWARVYLLGSRARRSVVTHLSPRVRTTIVGLLDRDTR